MSTATEITELFHRYLSNACTTAEIKRLLAYFEAGDNEALLKPMIHAALENKETSGNEDLQFTPGEGSQPAPGNDLYSRDERSSPKDERSRPGNEELQPILIEAFHTIQQRIDHRKSRSLFHLLPPGNRWLRYAAAAVLLIAIGISGWLFYKNNQTGGSAVVAVEKATPPEPGGNKALLKLADGRIIILDSAANGSLGNSGTVQITKMEGLVVFSADKGTGDHLLKTTVPPVNTISTPRGGQYQVVLPDGSRVWLNAASSLTFPTTFTGKERTVEVSGEAYFEIATDAAQPFYVTTRNMQIQVLGTSFNINAYEDEPHIKTTLLEGKVKIIRGTDSRTLQPGQQSIVEGNADASGITVRAADTDEVIAWKKGLFVFNNADIMSIMRQVARWYDVEIKWNGKPSGEQFTGEVSRNSKITEVLKILELNNIHTKIEGKTITLMP